MIVANRQYPFEIFLNYLTANKSTLQALLLKHGALLFRNFPVKHCDHFAEMIQTLGLGSFVNYIGGDSPRDKVNQHVYTSTEAPPSFQIPLHQELSFVKNHPRHIYFYCEVAPKVGGETTIGDARQIFQAMPEKTLQKFQKQDLTYTSRYYYQSMIMKMLNRWQRSHKSWTEVFETTEKAEVERKCLDNEFTWQWLKQDWVEIKQNRPALQTHPLTGETVWFNQVHLYNFTPRLLGLKNYLGAKLFYIKKSMRLHEATFANGEPITKKNLYLIMDVLHNHTVHFAWHKNDVLVLDNILAMHGRAPFIGPRRILTAMTS